MERTKEYSVVNDTLKALKNQGLSERYFQKGHSFSSQARYDHFDTAPYMLSRRFFPPFSGEKGLWKELTERTANLFNFRTG